MIIIRDVISDFLESPDHSMVDPGTGYSIGATIKLKPVMITEAPWVQKDLSWFKVISNRIWIISLVP